MFLLIFSGIVTVALLVGAGVAIGDIISEPEEMRKSFYWMDLISVIVYVKGTLMMGWLFCFTLSEYVAAHMGYSTSKYRMEKKIVSPGKACANETDTVYFFKRNN